MADKTDQFITYALIGVGVWLVASMVLPKAVKVPVAAQPKLPSPAPKPKAPVPTVDPNAVPFHIPTEGPYSPFTAPLYPTGDYEDPTTPPAGGTGTSGDLQHWLSMCNVIQDPEQRALCADRINAWWASGGGQHG